jgi:general secretion pathway protein B
MSLILEALNRSQQDRQPAGRAPGLDTPAYIDDVVQERRWLSVLPWLALAAAVLVIGLLLVEKFSDFESPGAGPVAPTASPGVIRPQRSVAPAVQPQPKFVPPAELATTAEVVSPSPLEPNPAVAVRGAAAPAAVDPAIAALYSSPQARSLPPGSSATTPAPDSVSEPSPTPEIPDTGNSQTQVTEQTIDIEEVLARTEEALKTARLEEHPAPFIANLSQQKKDEIPTILYSGHDFSSDGTQSSVVLNSKQVKTGGTLAGGIKLDEILPDSIVLSHRGEQFRLRALNSWVNL